MEEKIIPFLGVRLSELPLEIQNYLLEKKRQWQLDEDNGVHARAEEHIRQQIAAMQKTRVSLVEED